MSIINTFPTTIQNGQVEDATVVMTLFSWIQSQTNGNACPATSGSAVLKGDGAGGTTAAVAGTDYIGVAPGLIFDYAGAAAPSGYLLCDGSAVSRTTYAGLFSAIGTTWGAGNGTTTFNVPDLRGRAAIGAGTGSGLTARTVGTQNIGEETHVLTVGELAAHNHGVNDPTHVHTVNDPGHVHSFNTTVYTTSTGSIGTGNGGANPLALNAAVTGISLNAAATGITTQNNGSGTAHNNMQPSAVVTKIIKT